MSYIDFEQETASVARFVSGIVDDFTPIYRELPEGFKTPVVYFPVPEINTEADTFSSYAIRFTWYIKFFCADSDLAYLNGYKVLRHLQDQHNVIPFVLPDGEKEGHGFKIDDPTLKTLDSGVCQITLSWRSARRYTEDEAQKASNIKILFASKK